METEKAVELNTRRVAEELCPTCKGETQTSWRSPWMKGLCYAPCPNCQDSVGKATGRLWPWAQVECPGKLQGACGEELDPIKAFTSLCICGGYGYLLCSDDTMVARGLLALKYGFTWGDWATLIGKFLHCNTLEEMAEAVAAALVATEELRSVDLGLNAGEDNNHLP